MNLFLLVLLLFLLLLHLLLFLQSSFFNCAAVRRLLLLQLLLLLLLPLLRRRRKTKFQTQILNFNKFLNNATVKGEKFAEHRFSPKITQRDSFPNSKLKSNWIYSECQLSSRDWGLAFGSPVPAGLDHGLAPPGEPLPQSNCRQVLSSVLFSFIYSISFCLIKINDWAGVGWCPQSILWWAPPLLV
jgi:hypothetical protein